MIFLKNLYSTNINKQAKKLTLGDFESNFFIKVIQVFQKYPDLYLPIKKSTQWFFIHFELLFIKYIIYVF